MALFTEIGQSGGEADRCRIQEFGFPHCVVNGGVNRFTKLGVNLPSKVLRDDSKSATDITLMEALKLKDSLHSKILERGTAFLNGHAKSPKSRKFRQEESRRRESRAKTREQVPSFKIVGENACGMWDVFSLGNEYNWVNMERKEVVKQQS